MNPIKALVKNAIEKPNILLGLVLVLLPSAFTLLFLVLYAFPLDFLAIGIMFAREVIVWLVAGVALYLLLYIAKGKEMSSKFPGLLTAFSFIYVAWLALTVAGFVTIMLVMPGLYGELSILANTPNLTQPEIMAALQSIPIQPAPFALIAFLGLGLFMIAAMALILYIIYQIIAGAAPAGRLTNIALWVIGIILFTVIQVLIP